MIFIISGAVGGETGKTMVLPEFYKIECSGSGGTLTYYGGLGWPVRVCHAGSASDNTYEAKVSILVDLRFRYYSLIVVQLIIKFLSL